MECPGNRDALARLLDNRDPRATFAGDGRTELALYPETVLAPGRYLLQTFPTPEEAEEFGELLFRANVDARSDLVRQVPGARHITDTLSGHYIHWEQPKLVIKQIREVVEAARKK